MSLVLGSVWRHKTTRARCVRVVGCTASGGVLVRACHPDGTPKSAKGHSRLLWPSEFHLFVCLCVVESVPSQGGG